MTICHKNGYTTEAILLSRTQTSMRVAIQGSGDTAEFQKIDGAWFSEEGESVEVEFAWMRKRDPRVPTVGDCVCPPELAARLIHLLNSCEDNQEAIKAVSRTAAACGHGLGL